MYISQRKNVAWSENRTHDRPHVRQRRIWPSYQAQLDTMYMWAKTWQNQQNECAPSEDSDQPGHLPSLIESSLCAQWVAKDPMLLHADSEDWSDWADAKADLSLRWVHTHFVGFVML